MDVSIAKATLNMPPSESSHTHTSTALKRARNQQSSSNNNTKPPKRRKRANYDRSRSDAGDDDGYGYGDDVYNSMLSAATRDTVLKLKKIKDPFDEELQQVVDSVFIHFDEQAGGDVDLAESALLLSSVTHVYTTQVKSLHEDVLAFAARLTGKEPPPQRGRKKKGAENEDSSATKEATNGNPDDENPVAPENPSELQGKEDTTSKEGEPLDDHTNDNEDTLEKETPVIPIEGTINSEPDAGGSLQNDNNPNENSENKSEEPAVNQSENNGVTTETESTQPNNEEGTPKDEQSATEIAEKLETEILNEIPSRCTRRQSERLKNILNLEKVKEKDYKLKKRKFDEDPPDLISCHEEWNLILAKIAEQGDIDIDEIPPILDIQVGRKRKKTVLNNNDASGDDDNCEACHMEVEVSSGVKEEEEVKDKTCEPPFELPVAIPEIPSGFNGQKYQTLDHLPNDVQERFHALVQEMHKLPFDYGLMQNDMFKEYHQKFLQAVSLLSQNSVLVKRPDEQDKKTETPPAALDLNDSQMSESDQTINSIAELLSQVRRQASEEYHKGKQSKSDADIPVSQMIATLKRIICSRYKKWHVRTDGDKAVFRRIKEFEDKVKAVLKKEAEQGLFDVKKYEMEVMGATMKESQESESDELGCPLSPILPPGAESPRSEVNWNLTCSSRRSSVAGSVDGSSSWIRLFDIFSHMKKIDHSETCRHFYAVLALLSHKNLAINYDTLFSKESAKLITKVLKSHSAININKYPVGAKIMNSRCPDIDRDEVLLAPVFTTESFQQVLEQASLSSGYQSDSQASGSTSGVACYVPHKTIEDAINEFVLDPGEPYLEDLFSRRRRTKN